VFVALGTGIGSALLLDGELYRGAFGVAPELGHIRVVPDGRPCPCGKSGCWERYCSGTALATTAVELLAKDHLHSPVLARLAASDPGQVTGQRVAAAAREGDPVACAALADLASWLGEGLALVADVFDPELMVIGGGVSESAPLFLDEAREHYAARLTGRGNRPLARVRVAQLGEAAAVVGAAELAREYALTR
jgi:glucokinase